MDLTVTQPTTIEATEGFILEFEAGTLPKERWTHQAHLITALWYLYKYPKKIAVDKLRCGIRFYNQATGGINNDTMGYHETITLFWVGKVEQHILSARETESFDELLQTLLAREDLKPDTVFRYYSRELVLSPLARKLWVEPDLKQQRAGGSLPYKAIGVKGLS